MMTTTSRGARRGLFTGAVLVAALCGGAGIAAAQVPPPPGSPPAGCTPLERVEAGRRAPDSVTVGRRRVPRTRAALRTLYPEPRVGLPFYPGERVVVGVAGRRLGLAVFDGCTLVPEWTGPERIPAPETITEFELVDAKAAPRGLRDARGYRVLHVTRWKGNPRNPAG